MHCDVMPRFNVTQRKFHSVLSHAYTILLMQLVNQTAESNCRSRCVEQGIEYVRLNPKLKEEIDAGEKNNELLLDMLWTTQQYLHDNKAEEDSSRRKMERLIHILRST